MPSPVGHVLAGVAAGCIVAGLSHGDRKVPATTRRVAVFAALGAAPDLDLLVGMHSGPTHSVGAAAMVGVAAYLVARRRVAASPVLFAVACAAAYASHILLDWLGTDASPPLGIMALWPFSRSYFESDLHLFMAISRRYYQGWVFVRQNLLALARELLILVPLLMSILYVRSRSSRR